MFKVVDLRTALFGPLSFSVDAQACLMVEGESGSGKSLLLRALADLDPSEGEVWLGDVERRNLSPTVWRRRVGMLPAEAAWWAETVGEHFPSDRQPDCSRLGFKPGVLDWEITRLSSGERQRLALLRVLSNEPDVLLLDEPTANLDRRNTAQVEELVQTYLREQAACCVWVSHDPEQVARIGTGRLTLPGGEVRAVAA